MKEQPLVRLAKQNRSREVFSPVGRNTRNDEIQALLTKSSSGVRLKR